jgi:two-component system cell cycle response regulator CpdR
MVIDFPNRKSEEDFLGKDSEILKEKAETLLNILIGEDDIDLAEIYSEILSTRGNKVKLTFDGLQCSRTYDNLQDKTPFDVVILDYLMPRKSGSQTAREILQKNPNQRIIFISAFGEKLLDDLEGIEDKIEFLTKPTRPSSLIEVIEKGHLWKEKPKKTTENWDGNIKWND